jgi:hypothetical protein
MLTEEQRAELEALGPETVRVKLFHSGVGRMALVPGLDTAPLRGDVEGWLAEKSVQEAAERTQTLRWAKIPGHASIASVVIGAIGVGVSIAAILVAIWLAR